MISILLRSLTFEINSGNSIFEPAASVPARMQLNKSAAYRFAVREISNPGDANMN